MNAKVKVKQRLIRSTGFFVGLGVMSGLFLGCSFRKDRKPDELVMQPGGPGMHDGPAGAFGGAGAGTGSSHGGAGRPPGSDGRSSASRSSSGGSFDPRDPSSSSPPAGGAGAPAPPSYPPTGNLRNPSVPLPPRVTGHSRVSISQASVGGPYIAMTFDDGPHPSNTPRLLDILRQRNIRATFYVVGTNARRYPDLMRRIVAEGHEIGNHTVNHVGLAKLSNDRIRTELRGAHDAIVQITGVPPLTVRPPYGSVTSEQKKWIHSEFGYTTVLWSVDPRDWQRPGVSVVSRRLVDGARNGGILLAHDIHPPTIDAMPGTFDELLRRGFQFVTVSQLMTLESAGAMGPPQVSASGPSTLDPGAEASVSEPRVEPVSDAAPADVSSASGLAQAAGS